jgi:phytoene synthase
MVERRKGREDRSSLRALAERDPDRALALLAAPAAARDALALLFLLDLRLGAVADRGGEPAAALLRLAWWRDALTALDQAPAPPEPLLRALAAGVLPHGVPGAALARLAEGWLALAEDAGDPAAVEEHAVERGGGLFVIAGRLCGVDDARLGDAGAGWALAERAGHAEGSVAAGLAAGARLRFAALGDARWPRRLRAPGTLVALARLDLAHGRRRAPAARLLRALRHRLTGR